MRKFYRSIFVLIFCFLFTSQSYSVSAFSVSDVLTQSASLSQKTKNYFAPLFQQTFSLYEGVGSAVTSVFGGIEHVASNIGTGLLDSTLALTSRETALISDFSKNYTTALAVLPHVVQNIGNVSLALVDAEVNITQRAGRGILEAYVHTMNRTSDEVASVIVASKGVSKFGGELLSRGENAVLTSKVVIDRFTLASANTPKQFSQVIQKVADLYTQTFKIFMLPGKVIAEAYKYSVARTGDVIGGTLLSFKPLPSQVVSVYKKLAISSAQSLGEIADVVSVPGESLLFVARNTLALAGEGASQVSSLLSQEKQNIHTQALSVSKINPLPFLEDTKGNLIASVSGVWNLFIDTISEPLIPLFFKSKEVSTPILQQNEKQQNDVGVADMTPAQQPINTPSNSVTRIVERIVGGGITRADLASAITTLRNEMLSLNAQSNSNIKVFTRAQQDNIYDTISKTGGSSSASGGSGSFSGSFSGTVTASSLSIGSLSGILEAQAGTVSASSTISIAFGGTGTSTAPTYGQLLLGNSLGGYDLVATSSLGITSGVSSQWTTSGSNIYYSTGNVGIGTTTPGSLLSVGNTSGINFSTATSTFSTTGGINLSHGCFALNGNCLTSYSDTDTNTYINASTTIPKTYTSNIFTGNNIFSGSLTFGSLDGILFGTSGSVGTIATSSLGLLTTDVNEGSNLYFTNARFDSRFITDLAATSSVSSITALPNLSLPATQLSSFGIPFYTYFSATTTDALAQGSTNKYYSSSLFSTDFATKSTSNLTEGSNLYYTDTRVNSYINASTTIPKTYSTNTWTASNIFNNGLTIGSLNGPLQANSGVVSATSSIGVLYGGTGLATAPSYGQVLLGNSLGGYTLTATSSLGLSSPWTTSGSNIYYSTGAVGVGTTTPFATLAVNPTAGQASNQFVVGSSTATNFIIDNSGNVGIGTTTPMAKLSLGSGQIVVPSGTVSLPSYSFSSAANTGIYSPSTGKIGFSFGGALKGTWDSSGLRIGDSTAPGGYVFQVIGSAAINGTLAMAGDFNMNSGGTVLANGGTNYFGGNTYFRMSSSPFTQNAYINGNTGGGYFLGSIGIATSSPWRTFSVAGTVAFNGLSAAGASDQYMCINPTTKEVTFAVACMGSSERFKHDIFDLNEGLDFINSLRPVSFEYNNTNQKSLGFIAEEVAPLDSRLVFYDSDGVTPRGITYEKFIPILTKAIQELSAKIESLLAWFKDGKFDVQGEVCVDDVCVSKEQFKQLLQNAGAHTTQIMTNTSSGGSTGETNNTSSTTETTSTTTDSTSTEETSNTETSSSSTTETTDTNAQTEDNTTVNTSDSGTPSEGSTPSETSSDAPVDTANISESAQ